MEPLNWLEVKNHKTLIDSLDKYISDERIEDYKCEICKKNVSLVKRNSLAELPNVLIVHLQRILFDYDNLQNNKINSRLDFPRILNLKKYSTEVLSSSINSNMKVEEQSGKNQNSSFYNKENSYYDYDLVGVVVHTGSADAGHYYSLINVKREGFENEILNNSYNQDEVNNWFEFNDSNINSFNIKNLEDECFGGSKGNVEESTNWFNQQIEEKEKCKNAYMLIYERKKKKPIKMKLDNKNSLINDIENQIVEINSENKVEVMKKFDIFNAEFSLEEESSRKYFYNNFFFDIELEEYFYFTPFYKIKKLVPKKHFDELYIDNLTFFNDQKIFHRNFNEFISKLLKSITQMVKEKQIDEKSVTFIFNITIKYLFEVFSISYYKDVNYFLINRTSMKLFRIYVK